MQYISFRLSRAVAEQVERVLGEFNYSTKSDFLRDAVREKLRQLKEEKRKQKAWDALFAARGIFKGKGKTKTDEEFYKWRKEYGEKLMKKLVEKYNLKP